MDNWRLNVETMSLSLRLLLMFSSLYILLTLTFVMSHYDAELVGSLTP